MYRVIDELFVHTIRQHCRISIFVKFDKSKAIPNINWCWEEQACLHTICMQISPGQWSMHYGNFVIVQWSSFAQNIYYDQHCMMAVFPNTTKSTIPLIKDQQRTLKANTATPFTLRGAFQMFDSLSQSRKRKIALMTSFYVLLLYLWSTAPPALDFSFLQQALTLEVGAEAWTVKASSKLEPYRNLLPLYSTPHVITNVLSARLNSSELKLTSIMQYLWWTDNTLHKAKQIQ